MVEEINRYQVKLECKQILREAQVSPVKFTILYQVLGVVLALIAVFCGGNSVNMIGDSIWGVVDEVGSLQMITPSMLGIFASIFASLLSNVLSVGIILYFIGIKKGQQMGYMTLFDGFSFAGKIILLQIVEAVFITLWSLLFVIPGIIATYRYFFAVYNLCENPNIGVMEAIDMSKHQTQGYKMQIFVLLLTFIGWNLLGQFPAQFMLKASLYGYMDMTIAIVTSTIWMAAISILYLPRLQLMLVSYFNIAKRSSGIGENARPQEDPVFTDFTDTTYTSDDNNPFEQ